jgi:flagellar biosynthesis chaperone FliJ
VKHFHTLIKLKKREVDVFRKQMNNLKDQKQFLEDLHQRMENDRLSEVELAGALTHMGVFFGDYSEAIKKKQELVQQQIRAVDKQMDIVAENMRVVFGEQKKFEIVLERKTAAAAYQQEQQEQQRMDERASRNQHHA